MPVVNLRLSAEHAKALDTFLADAMNDALDRMEGAVADGNLEEAQEALRDRNAAHAMRYELSRVRKEAA